MTLLFSVLGRREVSTSGFRLDPPLSYVRVYDFIKRFNIVVIRFLIHIQKPLPIDPYHKNPTFYTRLMTPETPRYALFLSVSFFLYSSPSSPLSLSVFLSFALSFSHVCWRTGSLVCIQSLWYDLSLPKRRVLVLVGQMSGLGKLNPPSVEGDSLLVPCNGVHSWHFKGRYE